MTFGSPSHRIESQVKAAATIMSLEADCMYLPNMAIISMRLGEHLAMRTFFVRARGRIALTSLQKVHQIYRNVLHENLPASAGTQALKRLLRAPPIYSLPVRCFLAFMSASAICGLSFGGSILDMWISGICACALQYLGLNAANKSAMYANVYEISVTIIVAFVARGLSSIPGDVFCYTAISSAGVVVILPGFTVLISSLELMSRNIFCGSVRIVYAVIYTLFLGFGLTIGSDLYLLVDPKARNLYYHINNDEHGNSNSNSNGSVPMTYLHGTFTMLNGTNPLTPIGGVLGIHEVATKGSERVIKGRGIHSIPKRF
ncbi:pheromone-regulated membrane protein 10 [Coprinopsis cinerea AmutBmut pab1-1]|nr:pheromone-regulated membrane protein 10 [Coprinopsis cinerea AmutBmut pab1-1]